MLEKEPLWTLQELKNLVLITLGSCVLASGVSFFLLPAEIATGGTPGMAMILHFLTGTSTGAAMLLINIPLLLVGMKYLDFRFGLRSIYSILVTSSLLYLLAGHLPFPPIKSLLLATLYGGICIGAGVGMVLKGHASAGGTTIIAKIVATYSHLKPGQVILFLDALIVAVIGVIFADMERMLWSMMSIYVTTQVIDRILTGAVPEKIVHIVSTKTGPIGEAINEQLQRDGTILKGHNLTAEKDKTILFVVVGARRIPRLRKIVLGIDPQALMIVMEASEMLGTSRKAQDYT